MLINKNMQTAAFKNKASMQCTYTRGLLSGWFTAPHPLYTSCRGFWGEKIGLVWMNWNKIVNFIYFIDNLLFFSVYFSLWGSPVYEQQLVAADKGVYSVLRFLCISCISFFLCILWIILFRQYLIQYSRTYSRCCCSEEGALLLFS